MTRSAFRPEIQALRAVAVALVVAFHLWPGAVRGGYVGVDVFFVISGFLITGHLRAEVARDRTVALWAFWGRRIRRLLPAASVVLACSFGAMLAFVPQSVWQRTVTEIAASAVSVQNWVLASDSVDYLGADNAPTLVQHYWSLSVEEQFYLVWPVLIVLVAMVARRHPLRGITVALAVVVGASLALAIVQTGEPSAYFNTLGRAWEFGAGGLLACVPAALSDRMRPAARAAVALAGAALIVLPALLYTSATPFPGLWATLPVAGTLAVIAARPTGRLVEARPVQFVGAVSYPLYLWHWPLVVLAPYMLGAPLGGAWTWAALALSLLLAWLTTRYIERPAQRAPLLARNRRVYALGAAALAVLILATGSTWGAIGVSTAAAAKQSVVDFETLACYGAEAMVDGSCERPFAAPSGMTSAFAAVDKGSLAQPCDSTTAVVERCEFGDLTDPDRSVVVIGNSHAGHLIAGLEEYGATHGWRITLMRKTGCTGVSTAQATAESDAACAAWSRSVLDGVLADDSVDAVVVATNNDSAKYLVGDGDGEAAVEQVRADVAANLAALVSAGKAVLAVGDVPGTPEPAPECVDVHHLSYDPCSSPRALGEEHGNIVAEAARQTAGVAEFSLLPYFCDAELCHVMIGGVVAYIDEHHLSASFSRSLGPYLGAAVAAQIAGIPARTAG